MRVDFTDRPLVDFEVVNLATVTFPYSSRPLAILGSRRAFCHSSWHFSCDQSYHFFPRFLNLRTSSGLENQATAPHVYISSGTLLLGNLISFKYPVSFSTMVWSDTSTLLVHTSRHGQDATDDPDNSQPNQRMQPGNSLNCLQLALATTFGRF